jgi:hypothetical protein
MKLKARAIAVDWLLQFCIQPQGFIGKWQTEA